ncbi:MAG: hypothetical protein IIY70_02695, partial [Oscillospiraceae bacterium]|nr:hypothetical protein [Oscillospiraceae bacterium]
MKRKKKQNKAIKQNQSATEELSSQSSLKEGADQSSDGQESVKATVETDSTAEKCRSEADEALFEELQAIAEQTKEPKDRESEQSALTNELEKALFGGEKPSKREAEVEAFQLKQLSKELSASSQPAAQEDSEAEAAEAPEQNRQDPESNEKKIESDTQKRELGPVPEAPAVTQETEEEIPQENEPVRESPLASMSYESVAKAAEDLKKEPNGHFSRDAVDEGEFLSEICTLIGDGTKVYQPKAEESAEKPQAERHISEPRPVPRISPEDLHEIPDNPEDIQEDDSTGVSG